MIEKINIKKTDKSIEQNALTFNTIGKIITRLVDDVYTHKFKKSPFNLIKKDHVEQFLQVSQKLSKVLKNYKTKNKKTSKMVSIIRISYNLFTNI